MLLHAGQGLEEHREALESPETPDVSITEAGAVVTLPTPSIVEESERFAEAAAIADGDLQPPSIQQVASKSCQGHALAVVPLLGTNVSPESLGVLHLNRNLASQVAVSSSGSVDIDELAGRKLSIWDLLRFTLPTLGVWVINPILRCDPHLRNSDH